MDNLKELVDSSVARIKANPKEFIRALKVVAVYGAIYILFISLLSYFEVTQEGIQEYFGQFGVSTIIVYILVDIFTSMTPLPDAPVTTAGVIIFGVGLGFLVIWLSMTISAVINFYLAKRLGRGFIVKSFPEASKYLDMFSKNHGVEAIILGRIFTFVTFDVISYAAGLTNMSFREYFFATILSLLPIALNYSFLGAAIASGNLLTTLIAGLISALFAIGMSLVARYVRKRYIKQEIQT